MTKEGYEVVTAFNGREALEKFEAEQPDIIFWIDASRNWWFRSCEDYSQDK